MLFNHCIIPIVTGALIKFLMVNPYIVATLKEAHFFDRHEVYKGGYRAYKEMVPPSLPGQVVVEKTPAYIRYEYVPQRVYQMNPNIKLIAILCDPIKRIVSDYGHESVGHLHRYKQYRPERHHTLEEMLQRNGQGINEKWEAVWTGFYDEQLETWLKYFSPKQILVLDGNTFMKDPLPALNKVENFLEVPVLITNRELRFVEKKM